MVSHNTFILAKFIELFPTKFHAIVSSQALDLFSNLLFNHGFPFLELPKYIILMLQDIYPDLSRVIINKGQHISFTTMWYNLRRASKIQMDIIQNRFSSINTYIEFHPALFPEHIMLAKIQFSYFLSIKKTSFAQNCQPSLTHMPKLHMSQSSSLYNWFRGWNCNSNCTCNRATLQCIETINFLSFHYNKSTLWNPQNSTSSFICATIEVKCP